MVERSVPSDSFYSTAEEKHRAKQEKKIGNPGRMAQTFESGRRSRRKLVVCEQLLAVIDYANPKVTRTAGQARQWHAPRCGTDQNALPPVCHWLCQCLIHHFPGQSKRHTGGACGTLFPADQIQAIRNADPWSLPREGCFAPRLRSAGLAGLPHGVNGKQQVGLGPQQRGDVVRDVFPLDHVIRFRTAEWWEVGLFVGQLS